jgi:hypothetical protein
MVLFYIRNHLPPDPVMELVVAQQIFNGIANLSVMMPSAGERWKDCTVLGP